MLNLLAYYIDMLHHCKSVHKFLHACKLTISNKFDQHLVQLIHIKIYHEESGGHLKIKI